ncbi:MAG: hypothetical protein B7C55_04315 [Actinomycetales bacterium mxb001]|nr:MAG: hypothetical protein B7C55_04315 [Actinomycetales bacterium mxb001]
MTALSMVHGLVLVLGAADTACAESGRDYQDGAAVLQVVRNRATSGWARYDGSLWGALWSPSQHAHGCRWPLTLGHITLGVAFLLDILPAPEWSHRALWYCGTYDHPGSCSARGGRRIVGQVLHTYWGR